MIAQVLIHGPVDDTLSQAIDLLNDYGVQHKTSLAGGLLHEGFTVVLSRGNGGPIDRINGSELWRIEEALQRGE